MTHTIYLCHLSRIQPGIPVLHIQARPQEWVRRCTVGSIPDLIPQGDEVAMMQTLVSARRDGAPVDDALFARYRSAYTTRLRDLAARGLLDPETLRDDRGEPISGPVAACCTCATPEARAGRCHRAWAAEVLATVPGWTVIADCGEISLNDHDKHKE